MEFKGNALRHQFESDQVNPHLKTAVHAMNGYFKWVLKKQMTVTSVMRDPTAQVDSCRKYNYRSLFEHTAGEAVDIRSRNLTVEEITKVIAFAEHTLDNLCRFKYHTKGTGAHFHMATKGKYRRQDIICKIVEDTPGASDCFVPLAKTNIKFKEFVDAKSFKPEASGC